LRQRPPDQVLADPYGRPVAGEISGLDSLLPADAAPTYPLAITFADFARLKGYDLPATNVRPGAILPLTLYWESLAWTPQNYNVFIQLVSANGVTLERKHTSPVKRSFPTSRWRPGDLVPDYYTFTVPPGILPGKYRFDLGLYSKMTGIRLPAVGPDGSTDDHVSLGIFIVPDPALDLQAITHRAEFSAGEPPLIRLLGYDLESQTVAPGKALNLMLYWQALRLMDQDFTVFVHLLDADGHIQAQQDMQPMEGRAPTSWWFPGEVFRDPHPVALSATIAPGNYILAVGLYHWPTLERLPLFDSAGQRLPEDRALFPPSITVKPNS
ncbi:MAG TPA: hypothetical protein VI688_02725, partial [Anaerolineales bacterium]|nr:hypothetical protein [Anaerolineales bacterium]